MLTLGKGKCTWPLLLFGLLVLGLLLHDGSSSESSQWSKYIRRNSKISLLSKLGYSETSEEIENQCDTAWENFKKKYPDTRFSHKDNFIKNCEFIINHAKSKRNYTLKMNRFGTTDFSNSESKGCLGENTLLRSENFCQAKTLKWAHHLPKTVDLRRETPGIRVKVSDQGSCLSCWAFSAVAVLEGWFARKKVTDAFSPQQLLDCPENSTESCSTGRSVPYAFKKLKNMNGIIATSQSYPYRGDSNKQKNTEQCPINGCNFNPDRYQGEVYNFTGTCVRVGGNIMDDNEEQLKAAVANHGPVSVSIFAELSTFAFYSSEIYDDKNCTGNKNPTHALTVVGYNTEAKIHYWIIKNSWGTDWGENGYMKMVMGQNLCGIANYAYFVMDAEDDSMELISPVESCYSFSPPRVNVNHNAQIICLITLYFIYVLNGNSME